MNAVALITGASRGIGRGIALELSRLGYNLVINFAQDLSAAEQTAQNCVAVAHAESKQVRAEICRADIGTEAGREHLLSFTRTSFGRLDLLVNNAGIAPEKRSDILEVEQKSFDRLIDVNLKGPFFLTQSAARWMIEQKGQSGSSSYKPKIITISSISAYTASVNRAEYCLSKAGLSMLTPLFAARLADDGILVYEIRPGLIATDMTAVVQDKYNALIDQGLTPIKRWGTPQDVGKAVGALAQDLLSFSTGEIINVDGGFHLRRL